MAFGQTNVADNLGMLVSALLYHDVLYRLYHELRHKPASTTQIFSFMSARIHQLLRKSEKLAPLVGRPPEVPPDRRNER